MYGNRPGSASPNTNSAPVALCKRCSVPIVSEVIELIVLPFSLRPGTLHPLFFSLRPGTLHPLLFWLAAHPRCFPVRRFLICACPWRKTAALDIPKNILQPAQEVRKINRRGGIPSTPSSSSSWTWPTTGTPSRGGGAQPLVVVPPLLGI